LSLVTPQLKLRFLTVPWSYTILVIHLRVYRCVVQKLDCKKRQSDAAKKKQQAKAKAQAADQQQQRPKEQLKRKPRMRKDLLQKRERTAAAKAAEAAKGKRNRIHTAPENRPQRTHDDLMKDMERLKSALV
jgi:hypothetical protein